ncbi:hypothetical protein [Fructobacillus tropaeoli]|uniref:hypothetical protein n=1 Tax=Fructobacillus tropaeoli TaxID=709323 RepID=UPI002DB412AE|nr:unnamed protein product [Fructobacillus tropaeoli]
MNHQLSIFDYLQKPKERRLRQDLLVSILTPAGIGLDVLPATIWLKERNRRDFNPKNLLQDGAGHLYVVQKVFKRKQHFRHPPLHLDSIQESLLDYLKPTVEPIIELLNQTNHERNYHAN